MLEDYSVDVDLESRSRVEIVRNLQTGWGWP